MTRARSGLLALTLLAALAPLTRAAAAAPTCNRDPAAHDALARLGAAMSHGRFAAYEPTSLRVVNGRVQPADLHSIRADLETLRPRFDALVTYDAVHGAQAIPGIAASLGFRALVIGVYDPTDAAQIAAALDAAGRYPRLIVGLSLGNELLFTQRTTAAALGATVASVRRRAPALALSTSEPFHIYQHPSSAALLGRLDFLLVNVHPVFQPWFRGASEATSAQFVVNVVSDLARLYCGPILVKETGIPTAPATAGFTPQRQAAFYAELRRRFPAGELRAFAYFAAFDEPWRALDASPTPGPHPEEAFWGLYDHDRRAKPAASELPKLPDR